MIKSINPNLIRSIMQNIQIYEISNSKIIMPLANSTVQAGFPSPAAGYEEERIDLSEALITNPASTFCVRVRGNSMIDANIFDGDLLMVDKSIDAVHGKVIIAVIDGDFTVKTLYKKDGVVKLIPANPEYPEIILSNDQELNVWGVVNYIIHKA